jgi:hypothetical protein
MFKLWLKITNVTDIAIIVHHGNKSQVMSWTNLIIIMVMCRSDLDSTFKDLSNFNNFPLQFLPNLLAAPKCYLSQILDQQTHHRQSEVFDYKMDVRQTCHEDARRKTVKYVSQCNLNFRGFLKIFRSQTNQKFGTMWFRVLHKLVTIHSLYILGH